MEPVEEIKSKLDIVDIISEYVSLKPAGSNFRGLCPFHQEKTPSFMVSPERQIFHCFGCGAGGDMFTFLMKLEGLEFPEVLRILAQKAGVVLKDFDQKEAGTKGKILEINRLTADFFQQNLRGERGGGAMTYLKGRKLSDETIKNFQLGWAGEEWDGLIKFLMGRNFTINEMAAAGVAILKDNQRSFDRFRNRIMFPLWDAHGTVVGFTGRILRDDPQQAKYVNSPESAIYSKSRVLYAVDKAKSAIKEKDRAVVVEGQMDTIMCHQHGYKNVVASSGTALTLDQLKLLKRYTNNVILAFDMDSAGQEATVRGIKVALQLDLNLKIVTGLQGKDPDQCLKENPELWEKALREAMPFMQYYIERMAAGVKQDDIKGKSKAVAKVADLIMGLGSKMEQDFWIKFLAQHVDYSEEVVRQELRRLQMVAGRDGGFSERKNDKNLASEGEKGFGNLEKDRGTILAERFLAMVIKFAEKWPYLIENYLKNLPEEILKTAKQKELAKKLNLYYIDMKLEKDDGFVLKSFIEKNDSQDLGKYIDYLVLSVENEWQSENEEEVISEVKRLYRLIFKLYWQEQLKVVEDEIKKAESGGKREEIEEGCRRLQEITKELSQLN